MSEKETAALEIVKRNALYSAGVGIIAIPVVNVLGVTALQVKMLRELADHYAVPFKEDRVKSILSSLLSGLVGTELGYGLTGAATGVPLVGGLLGMVTLPFFAGAATWATGKIFIQHFASGGTFLDFDPEKVRGHFREQFGKAKATAAAATS